MLKPLNECFSVPGSCGQFSGVTVKADARWRLEAPTVDATCKNMQFLCRFRYALYVKLCKGQGLRSQAKIVVAAGWSSHGRSLPGVAEVTLIAWQPGACGGRLPAQSPHTPPLAGTCVHPYMYLPAQRGAACFSTMVSARLTIN